ncbi:hypothetical protein, conserved [Babesia bigemina]|uniref:Sel1 repeat family protein n=1 Tax=Babesia bigemina TaxID=5866 RepID=A0A061D0C1_BABBI|nr:hypothetical protein, conserved [Babesia bigemina]CDR94123.1 hypothetical protein, conserved [Babesia bigemina]|eukprot:XP_012766309.1 hypothetical protein, conserved [Babesia bigemina]
MEEVERSIFESWMVSRLAVREFGRFDMVEQGNGRLLRWGTVMVPRRLEIMLHLLNSPVLHESTLSNTDMPHGTMNHFQLLSTPLRVPAGGTAHVLAVALLRNDRAKLKQYEGFKRDSASWPTYLDNEAAYTYLWRVLSQQFKVYRQPLPYNGAQLKKQLIYCYRNYENEVLIFKYHVALDTSKHNKFARLISHWSVDKMPVNQDYAFMLDGLLAGADRSYYPEEMFDNIGHFSDFVSTFGTTDEKLLKMIMRRPLLKPRMTLDECLDAEAAHIAKITIRLAHVLMGRMLVNHGIPAFMAMRSRRHVWRVHGVLGTLRRIRAVVNEHLLSAPGDEGAQSLPLPNEIDEIEEILFESSKTFHPYWAMKNDTLYHTVSGTLNDDGSNPMGLIFDPNRLLQRLLNVKAENIDFQMVHDVLHRVTALSTPSRGRILFRSPDTCRIVDNMLDKIAEQYESLPAPVRSKLVAKCRCLLAFLYMFGIVSPNGRLELPGGWPRDIARSLAYITDGIGSSCGMCNSILGFLSGIGYPPVAENMYAWETRKTHLHSTVYQMLVTSGRAIRKRHTEYYDKTLLSYLSGHYKEDDASSLAVGYYLYSGIGAPSRLLDDIHVRSGVERSPKAVGSQCIEALPYVLDAAKSAMRTRMYVINDEGSAEYRSRRYAEFIKKLALMGDVDGLRVMGDFHFNGHEAGNIGIDVPRALEYWTRAAHRGEVISALTMANHLINLLNYEGNGDASPQPGERIGDDIIVTAEQLQLDGTSRADIERAAERYLNIAAESSNQLAAATARYYAARYGIGQPRDPTVAARHLQDAADRGDTNSQLLMGHAYAGMLSDITPADGKNVFMALEYYRRAARSGNIVAAFNTAVLTLHGYDLKYTSSIDRCKASFTYFQQVGRQAPLPAVVRALSVRAARHGDELGHALLSMFLSEMGDPQAHIEAANHFKNNHKLCYVGGEVTLVKTAGRGTTSNTAVIPSPPTGVSKSSEIGDAKKLMGQRKAGDGNGAAKKAGAGSDSGSSKAAVPGKASKNALAEMPKRSVGIFTPYVQNEESSVTSECHIFYARRSGHAAMGGSPLLLAEALMDRYPDESAKWVLEAKIRNEPKAAYLYATMLEAGTGVAQDCQASYGYYSSMTESREHTNKMLGFLCIQRTRISHLLHRWHYPYGWFVSNFYDAAVVPHLLAEDYKPCHFALPAIKPLETVSDKFITVTFAVAVLLSSLVYIKLR